MSGGFRGGPRGDVSLVVFQRLRAPQRRGEETRPFTTRQVVKTLKILFLSTFRLFYSHRSAIVPEFKPTFTVLRVYVLQLKAAFISSSE